MAASQGGSILRYQDTNEIAVLIDADNTQLSKLEFVLREISTRGRIVVKRAYGNWAKPTLGNWDKVLNELAIKAEQQFDYVSGKNATDIALTIDAMDLLARRLYDTFVLVSSDSDFTPLAVKLRESGVEVIGVGTRQTSPSFRNACDVFLFLENLGDNLSPAEAAAADENEMQVVHELLVRACENFSDESGWTNMATAGNYLRRAKPDFDCRNFGFDKLSNLIEAFPQNYEVHRASRPNGPDILYYRVY